MTLEDLYRLLRSGHVQAQGVLDTLDVPLLVLDQGMCVVTANPAFLRAFKTSRDDTVGHALFELGNGQWDIPDLRQLLSSVIPRAAAIVDYEISHAFPDIGERTFLITARKLAHPDGNSQQILIVFTDITKRRIDSAAKDILLNESRHRMKNLLAVVRALAHQTRTEGETALQYRKSFLERLDCLAVTQELAMAEADGVDFETLVRQTLQSYTDRIALRPGANPPLANSQVQPLGMSLNELATNAVKYGALSVPDGSINLSWEVEHEGERQVLSVVWTEENGPEVDQPDHEGFGTGLINHSVTGALDGEVDIAYDKSGVNVRIRIPLDRNLE
ncbi:PAS domain-containing sensor histidine kinase [Pelagibacterium limicola]|uniref:PAS domain-containing sensor histidine kinase n=1 Tax=Pelagibacterium limicola TaxID=2791022 RepID=UPI0018AF9188|nr:PAS domain-containing sensor histidine kinase [Pelagibacterium limicola]